MDIEKSKLLAGWQAEFDPVEDGKVLDVIASVGNLGGLAIYVKVRQGGKVVYYSPYYEQNPSEEDVEAVEESPDAWLWMMLGATNWSEWDWGTPTAKIPAH